MKTYCAKVVVKLKPTIADVRGQTLKKAIESLYDIKNLNCRIGTSFSLEFDSENQVEALSMVNKISKDLLYNEITEFYEVRSLKEV